MGNAPKIWRCSVWETPNAARSNSVCLPLSPCSTRTHRNATHSRSPSNVSSFPPGTTDGPRRPVDGLRHQQSAGPAGENPQPFQQRLRGVGPLHARCHAGCHGRCPSAAVVRLDGFGPFHQPATPSYAGSSSWWEPGLHGPSGTHANGSGCPETPHLHGWHQLWQPQRTESPGHSHSERTTSAPRGRRGVSAANPQASARHGPGPAHVHVSPTILTVWGRRGRRGGGEGVRLLSKNVITVSVRNTSSVLWILQLCIVRLSSVFLNFCFILSLCWIEQTETLVEGDSNIYKSNFHETYIWFIITVRRVSLTKW